jgi:hypothetical protein
VGASVGVWVCGRCGGDYHRHDETGKNNGKTEGELVEEKKAADRTGEMGTIIREMQIVQFTTLKNICAWTYREILAKKERLRSH